MDCSREGSRPDSVIRLVRRSTTASRGRAARALPACSRVQSSSSTARARRPRASMARRNRARLARPLGSRSSARTTMVPARGSSASPSSSVPSTSGDSHAPVTSVRPAIRSGFQSLMPQNTNGRPGNRAWPWASQKSRAASSQATRSRMDARAYLLTSRAANSGRKPSTSRRRLSRLSVYTGPAPRGRPARKAATSRSFQPSPWW